MKMQFTGHGIPVVCVSDNGPQFSAQEYKNFSKQWKFDLLMKYPRSKGKVENAVGGAKGLMTPGGGGGLIYGTDGDARRLA